MSFLPRQLESQFAAQRGDHVVEKSPRRKTRPWVLAGGLGLAALTLIFWSPVQREFLTFLLLHSDAPSEQALSDAVEQVGNPGALLTRLWQTERLPHRQFVIGYLGRLPTSRSNLFRALEPLLIAATADPDNVTRQLAFSALGRVKHPQLRRLALEQLSDADPAVRLIGLQSLRGVATTNDVPIAVGLLNDPEPRVVVMAALLLRQVTGQDFGIKSNHALPQFTCIGTNPPPAPDWTAIKQGVQGWHDWWIGHQAEFPASLGASTSAAATQTPRLAAPGFSLKESAGRPVRLSQFRGKSVLLAFWSMGVPASLDDMPALKALAHQNPDRLVVLGICIPPAPSCSDQEGDHGGHAHHHHGQSSTTSGGPAHMRMQVREAVERLKVDYPMLIDSKGVIGLRYNAEDLPVYVLIDEAGIIRRRLVGFRSEGALAALCEETLRMEIGVSQP